MGKKPRTLVVSQWQREPLPKRTSNFEKKKESALRNICLGPNHDRECTMGGTQEGRSNQGCVPGGSQGQGYIVQQTNLFVPYKTICSKQF